MKTTRTTRPRSRPASVSPAPSPRIPPPPGPCSSSAQSPKSRSSRRATPTPYTHSGRRNNCCFPFWKTLSDLIFFLIRVPGMRSSPSSPAVGELARDMARAVEESKYFKIINRKHYTIYMGNRYLKQASQEGADCRRVPLRSPAAGLRRQLPDGDRGRWREEAQIGAGEHTVALQEAEPGMGSCFFCTGR